MTTRSLTFLLLLVTTAAAFVTASSFVPVQLNLLDLSSVALPPQQLATINDGTIVRLGNDVCSLNNFCDVCAAGTQSPTNQELLKVIQDTSSFSMLPTASPDRTYEIDVLQVFRCIAVYGLDACIAAASTTTVANQTARITFDPFLFQRPEEHGEVITVLADQFCSCATMDAACKEAASAPVVYYGDAIQITFKLLLDISKLGDLSLFKPAFILDIVHALGGATAFDGSRLSVTGIRAGSTFVDLLVLPSTNPSDLTPAQVVAILQAQAAYNTSGLMQGVWTSSLDPTYQFQTLTIAECPDGSFESPCICASAYGGSVQGSSCVCNAGFSGTRCEQASFDFVRIHTDLNLNSQTNADVLETKLTNELASVLSVDVTRFKVLSLEPKELDASQSSASILIAPDTTGQAPGQLLVSKLKAAITANTAAVQSTTVVKTIILSSLVETDCTNAIDCSDINLPVSSSSSNACQGYDCRWFLPVVIGSGVIALILCILAVVCCRKKRQQDANVIVKDGVGGKKTKELELVPGEGSALTKKNERDREDKEGLKATPADFEPKYDHDYAKEDRTSAAGNAILGRHEQGGGAYTKTLTQSSRDTQGRGGAMSSRSSAAEDIPASAAASATPYVNDATGSPVILAAPLPVPVATYPPPDQTPVNFHVNSREEASTATGSDLKSPYQFQLEDDRELEI